MNKVINIAGKEIHYSVIGNGKTVMLVHGFGEKADVWDHQVEHLKNKYKLIIPDLPGSGKSDIIDDMSMEGMAEVLKTVLDIEDSNSPSFGEGRGEVAMIGHSMGGYITLAFAAKFPAFLNSFGLFHSTAYADNEEKIAARQKGIAFIREHGAFEFLKTATPKLFSDKTKHERPELVDEQIAGLSNFSAPALVLYYQSMIERPDRTAVLKEAGVPVLFIMGKYDTAVPMQDVLEQCHLPEKSYIHILHESGHMGMLEETEKSNRVLEEFLPDI
jgi:pimeloyl-ACP methyl ester carboxylesterase